MFFVLYLDVIVFLFVSDILIDMFNGCLYKLLVEKGLVMQVYVMLLSGYVLGLQMIVVQVKVGVDIELVKQVMISVVEFFSIVLLIVEELVCLCCESVNNFEMLQNNLQQMVVVMFNVIVCGEWCLVFIECDLEQCLISVDIVVVVGCYFCCDNCMVGFYLLEDYLQCVEVLLVLSVELLLV